MTFAAGTATLTQPITVTVTGDVLVEADERFFVNLSNASANATITDNQGLGTITTDDNAAITISDATAVEGAGLQFTVTLDTAVAGAFTVTTGYGDVTTDGLDYDHSAQVLNFAGTAGETNQFTVTTTDDALVEGAETFTVTLTASNPLVTATGTATGTITDNDAASLTIEDVTEIEGTGLLFTVTLDNAVAGAFTVDTSYSDGSTEAADFYHTTQTLNFLGTAGETQQFTVATTATASLAAEQAASRDLQIPPKIKEVKPLKPVPAKESAQSQEVEAAEPPAKIAAGGK